MNILLDKSGIFFASSFDGINKHFNGYCYHNKDIIVGEKAFFNYLNDNSILNLSEGRFTAVFKDSHFNWTITNDDSGQGIIYYYKNGGDWAASNSFLFLAEKLYSHQVKLKINLQTILGFRANHSTTEQLISNNTMIKEIKTLPLHQEIKIIDGKIKFFSKTLPLSKDYIEDLIHYRDIYAGRLRSLHQGFSSNFHVDITGGYDSRAVFSLILASGVDLKSVNFRSNKRLIDDYNVATNLSKEYGFSITNSSFKDKVHYSSDEVFELWKYGNLGVYFPVYLEVNSINQSNIFHLHGAGGGSLRGLVNDASTKIVLSRLTSRIKDIYSVTEIAKFKEEFLYGAECAGIKPDCSLSNVYYSHYRSRFHFGRNQYRNLYSNLITPLTSTWLYFINEQGYSEKYGGNIFIDLMLLSNQKLPTISFDKEEKNFSNYNIEKSYFYNKEIPVNHYDFNVFYEKESDTYISKCVDESDPYQILCNEVSEILSESNLHPLIDKALISSTLDEIKFKKNLTKNYKILSFYYSIFIVSKLCSDV